MSIAKYLQALSPTDRRMIEKEFEQLNSKIRVLENKKITLSQDILEQIRDVAKRESQYNGSKSLATWRVKDVIRIPEEEIRKAVDVVVYKSGDLVIRGDLTIGN